MKVDAGTAYVVVSDDKNACLVDIIQHIPGYSMYEMSIGMRLRLPSQADVPDHVEDVMRAKAKRRWLHG